MEFRITQNTRLTDTDTGGQTSTVCEPSGANVGDQILVTGNWYASRSLDGGQTWAHISPFSYFPSAAGGFCCDQTVIHAPRPGDNQSNDLLVWILQYIKTDSGNTLRIAINKGKNLDDDNWYWWDLVPNTVNQEWQQEWFDYNHAALSDNYLYVATNVFRTTDDHPTRSVVFRFSLDDLAGEKKLNFDYFQTPEGSSLRCSQGASDVMYFTTHLSDRQIRVYSWAETEQSPSPTNINITPWIGRRGYKTIGPGGQVNMWLGRSDPRITATWVANGIIGVMWSVDKNPTLNRPQPHVRVVRLNEATKEIEDEPDIWNASFAYAYPDACPNIDGEVGITLFRGGGTIHPSHVVGIWNTDSWSLQGTINGTHSPIDNKWGDYLTCRRHSPDGRGWLASGFTLQGGGMQTDIQPCIIHFDPVPIAPIAADITTLETDNKSSGIIA